VDVVSERGPGGGVRIAAGAPGRGRRRTGDECVREAAIAAGVPGRSRDRGLDRMRARGAARRFPAAGRTRARSRSGSRSRDGAPGHDRRGPARPRPCRCGGMASRAHAARQRDHASVGAARDSRTRTSDRGGHRSRGVDAACDAGGRGHDPRRAARSDQSLDRRGPRPDIRASGSPLRNRGDRSRPRQARRRSHRAASLDCPA